MRIHPLDNPVYAQTLVAIQRGHDTAPSITKRLNLFGTKSERGRRLKPDDIRHYLRELRKHEFVTKKGKQHYFIDYAGIGFYLAHIKRTQLFHKLDEEPHHIIGRVFLTFLNHAYPFDDGKIDQLPAKDVTINNTREALEQLLAHSALNPLVFTKDKNKNEPLTLLIEDEETRELRPLTRKEENAVFLHLLQLKGRMLFKVADTHREGWLAVMKEENKKRFSEAYSTERSQ